MYFIWLPPVVCSVYPLIFSFLIFLWEVFLRDGDGEFLDLAGPYGGAFAVAPLPAQRETADAVEQAAERGGAFVLRADAAQKPEPERKRDAVAERLVARRIRLLVFFASAVRPIADVRPSVRVSLKTLTIAIPAE